MQANDALWIMLLAFVFAILFFIVWFLSYDSLQQTYNVNGLNEANRLALYDSIDYASRGQRGVFYLDVARYKYDLSKMPIKRFDHKTLEPDENCRILVLPDTYNSDNGTVHTNNYQDYQSNLGSKWEGASLTSDSSTGNNLPPYVPIRGILIATDFSDTSVGNYNKSGETTGLKEPTVEDIFGKMYGQSGKGQHSAVNPNIYVSADLINTYGRPIRHGKNPYDTDNDISR